MFDDSHHWILQGSNLYYRQQILFSIFMISAASWKDLIFCKLNLFYRLHRCDNYHLWFLMTRICLTNSRYCFGAWKFKYLCWARHILYFKSWIYFINCKFVKTHIAVLQIFDNCYHPLLMAQICITDSRYYFRCS